jgi:hypothetical protein
VILPLVGGHTSRAVGGQITPPCVTCPDTIPKDADVRSREIPISPLNWLRLCEYPECLLDAITVAALHEHARQQPIQRGADVAAYLQLVDSPARRRVREVLVFVRRVTEPMNG